jgi:hypothetical protein
MFAVRQFTRSRESSKRRHEHDDCIASSQLCRLTMIGSATTFQQTAQPFTITYTDGTTKTLNIDLSGWTVSQGYADETIVEVTEYRNTGSGGRITGTEADLYGYQIVLDSTKVVKASRPEQSQCRDRGDIPQHFVYSNCGTGYLRIYSASWNSSCCLDRSAQRRVQPLPIRTTWQQQRPSISWSTRPCSVSRPTTKPSPSAAAWLPSRLRSPASLTAIPQA